MPRLNINSENSAAMRDYNHAAKTFTSGAGYTLAPYSAFLFHVVLYFNRSVGVVNSNSLETPDQRVLAVLVKASELPSIGYQTETLNQYNKKAIIKKKVEYEPLKLTFQDDVARNVRNLWNLYNAQYNADLIRPQQNYNDSTPYSGSSQYRWGLDSQFVGDNSKKKFITKIEIYSMGDQQAHVTTLINPIISKAGFDEHEYSEGSKTLAVNFDIEYEGVHYQGGIDANDIAAFGRNNQEYYDQTQGNLGQRNLDRGSSLSGIVRTVDDFVNRVDRTINVIKSIDNLTDFLFFTGAERTARQIDTIAGKVNERTSRSFSEPQYVNFKNNIALNAGNSPNSYNFPDVSTYLNANTQGARTINEETRGVSQTPTPEQIVYSQPTSENSINQGRQNQVTVSTQLNLRYSTASENSDNFANAFVNQVSQSRSVSSNGVNVAANSGASFGQTLTSTIDSAILISATPPANLSPVEQQLFERLYPPLPSTDPRTREVPYI